MSTIITINTLEDLRKWALDRPFLSADKKLKLEVNQYRYDHKEARTLLVETGDPWTYSVYFDLKGEAADAVMSIWKFSEREFGLPQPKGYRTVVSILEKLGDTKIREEVENLKTAARIEADANYRKSREKFVYNLCEELLSRLDEENGLDSLRLELRDDPRPFMEVLKDLASRSKTTEKGGL